MLTAVWTPSVALAPQHSPKKIFSVDPCIRLAPDHFWSPDHVKFMMYAAYTLPPVSAAKLRVTASPALFEGTTTTLLPVGVG